MNGTNRFKFKIVTVNILLKSIFCMLEYSVPLALSDVEDMVISWVYQCINIRLQFFYYFLCEHPFIIDFNSLIDMLALCSIEWQLEQAIKKSEGSILCSPSVVANPIL